MSTRRLAVVTGASSGIGLELARYCARDGYDIVVCAEEPEIDDAAAELAREGASVLAVQADLATEAGVTKLVHALDGRPVDALLANAGIGLGGAFLDQDLDRARAVIRLNVLGTMSLIHAVGRRMRERNSGRILITGSIADSIPGSFQAVYNGTKAFLSSFSYALRDELRDTDVTVTCLMPGPIHTGLFERAEMEDTPVGKDEDKADAAKVAKDGYEAMQKGSSGVVSGFNNKLQSALAAVAPPFLMARMHRRMAEPERGSHR